WANVPRKRPWPRSCAIASRIRQSSPLSSAVHLMSETTMTSERADQPATPELPQHGDVPGRALAAQREALGWTVEQVAEQLKLQVRQVIAIEAGDYAALPSPAVTRGFVRAYAKIVRLDPAPLVAMIPMDSATPAETTPVARPQKPATFSESSRFPLHGKRSSMPAVWVAVAIVVVAAAAAAWHLGMIPHGKAEAPAASSPVAAPAAQPGTTTEPVQKTDVPLISVPGQTNPAPNGDVQPGAVPPANGVQPSNGAAAPAEGAAPTAGAGAGAAAAPAPAAAKPVQTAAETTAIANALVLNVNQDSWIEVSAPGGKKLISRLVKAGSTETVPVDQPVTLIVGNPKGVNATLRGAAVELPPLPGKVVSRVSLK
ncbi:MAG: helix-turn-helix domain-containing protein, partial [Ramlibacter sp.]